MKLRWFGSGQRDEDSDDVAFREQWDERGALRSQRIGQGAVHVRRGDGVVDGKGSTLADDRDDRPLLLVEVERDRPPPVLVDASRGEADGGPQLLVDARQEERIGPEQDLDLFEEQGRGLLSRLRAREGRGEPRDRVGLAAPLAGDRLRLVDAPARRDEQGAVVASHEHDDPGHGDRRGA